MYLFSTMLGGLSLVVVSGGHSLVEVHRFLLAGGFSCCGAWALWCMGFESCDAVA